MYRWELDSPADQEFADLNPAAQASLAAFMDFGVCGFVRLPARHLVDELGLLLWLSPEAFKIASGL
jgi:hypothetical protein